MRFLIACGPGRTGGPEALHQLAHTLVLQGFVTSVVYVQEVSGALVWARCNQNQYPEYDKIIVASDLLLSDDVVLVLPEVWAALALEYASHCKVLVWWLSVDNGLPSIGEIAFYFDAFRSHPRIFHAYQSAYARNFIESLGLNRGGFSLSDFIHGSSMLVPVRVAEQSVSSIQICFNASKGAWLAEAFGSQHPSVEMIPIRGMGPDRIQEVLRTSHFYIEFGHLPGKDRLPREALQAGTRVYLRCCGDGAQRSDWLLPPHCYFNSEDCVSGSLWASLLNEIRHGNQAAWLPAQAKIAGERKVFEKECENLATFFQNFRLSDPQELLAARLDQLHRYPGRRIKAEKELDAIVNSTSWKSTAFLRAIIARIQGH